MSALLAAINTVAASPVPSATPQVIREIITNNTIAQTPPEVLQLGQMLALAGGTALTSLLHQVVEAMASKSPAGWSGNVNRLLLTLYSTAAALLTAYFTGNLQFDAQGGLVIATSFLVAIGSATGRYELFNFLASLGKPKAIKSLATSELPDNAPA